MIIERTDNLRLLIYHDLKFIRGGLCYNYILDPQSAKVLYSLLGIDPLKVNTKVKLRIEVVDEKN